METTERKVIDMQEHRPHRVGLMLCVACSYQAVGVLPVDAHKYDLECPRCHELKGSLLSISQGEEAERK